MNLSSIPGFAEEKTHLEFSGFWDWFVIFNNVSTLWRAQPSYILVQLLFLGGSLISLFHALKNGGRFIHLWVGIVLHGIVVEFICFNLPDIDNYWHSQTPIIFLGGRLPLYIILLYPAFIYPATIAVNRLNLPRWSEPFAVGLVVVLIDYPYDLIGVRFNHWTWHDTDPNILDRHYYIPWNSFYFHASFAASYTFWFHFSRRIAIGKTEKWISSGSFVKEFACTTIAGLFGMPGGVLLFIPLYHPLHDLYNIHSEVTFFLLVTIYLSIILLSFPRAINSNPNSMKPSFDWVILLHLFTHYMLFIGIAVFFDPTTEVSIGWHEPIGPCNEKTSFVSALGHTMYKRKYLCLTDNDENYFGWSCLPNGKPPRDGAYWYTICGTSFTERVEYISILIAITVFGLSFFFKTLYCNSGACNNIARPKVGKKVKHK